MNCKPAARCFWGKQACPLSHKTNRPLGGASCRRDSRKHVSTGAGKGFGSSAPQSSPQPVQTKQKSQKAIQKMGKRVSSDLNSTNVVIIGDHQELSESIVNELAPMLEYIPIHTSQLIEKSTGTPVSQIIADEGPSALGAAEAVTLESLSTHLRCCISTCGGGVGAAARDACWKHLHGAITVWIDDGQSDPDALQNQAYCLADLQMKVEATAEESYHSKEVATAIIQEALPGIAALLDKDAELCKKKGLYVRLGCRGDWPDLNAPEWTPDSESN